MAFVVGNKTFSSLRDAQAYLDSLQEFGGGGSITPFDTSLLTGSGDRTSTRMFQVPRFEDLPGQDPFRNMADRLFQQFIEIESPLYDFFV